jgi:multidrug efflux system membrane fusion protein
MKLNMLRQLNYRWVCLSAALLFFSGCKPGAASPAAAARPPAAVTAAAAVTRDVPVYLDAIGKTVSPEVVTIIPQVGGKVTQTNVVDGAYVKKDDVLFMIDPRPYQAALDSAQATRKQNESELILAQAEMRRVEELKPTNVVSPLEYDQKTSALGVAQAKIDSADAAIKMAQLDVEYCTIKSPISGRAGVRWLDAGNIVKANEGTMLVIQRLDPIYAEFTVTENDLGTVRKYLASRGMETGNESNMGLKCLVDVPADSQRILSALGGSNALAATQPATRPAGPREATLSFLDNSVQSNTGTVKLRATVPNADRYFWPGQFVNVRLILTTKKDAVLIPAEAQQIGQQGPYVYVVTKGDIEDPATKQKKPATLAEIRPIVPGQRQGEMIVVEKGVNPGDQVVVSGQMLVVPGGPVNVLTPPAAQTTVASSEQQDKQK